MVSTPATEHLRKGIDVPVSPSGDFAAPVPRRAPQYDNCELLCNVSVSKLVDGCGLFLGCGCGSARAWGDQGGSGLEAEFGDLGTHGFHLVAQCREFSTNTRLHGFTSEH